MTDLPPEDSAPFPDDVLDEYLELTPGSDTGPVPVPDFDRLRKYEPTDDVEAEKLMRRLVLAHRRRAAIIKQAEDLIVPIEEWRDRELAPFERRIAWLSDHLTLYAVKRRIRLGEKDPQAKTLRLPSGDVPTTRKAPRVDVLDADEFTAWAELAAPELIRWPDPPPAAPAKREITKAVQIVEKDGDLLPVLDGEVVPGLVVLDVEINADPKPDLSAP